MTFWTAAIKFPKRKISEIALPRDIIFDEATITGTHTEDFESSYTSICIVWGTPYISPPKLGD